MTKCISCHNFTDNPKEVKTYHGVYYLCPVCYQKFTEMFDYLFNHPETEEDG